MEVELYMKMIWDFEGKFAFYSFVKHQSKFFLKKLSITCHLDPLSPTPMESIRKVVTHSSLSFFFTMTEHVAENEVRVEKKMRKKKIAPPKKASQKQLQPNPPQVNPKRIKRKREIDEASQIEKPKKVIHLMIYPVHSILL